MAKIFVSSEANPVLKETSPNPALANGMFECLKETNIHTNENFTYSRDFCELDLDPKIRINKCYVLCPSIQFSFS